MFLFIFICMCFVAGVALHWFAIGGVLGGVGFWALWDLNKMPKYMKLRFQVLFDHTLDVQNTGWQQTRSLMALGSGKLTGEGLFRASTAPRCPIVTPTLSSLASARSWAWWAAC